MGVIVLLVAALSLVVPSSLAWIGTWVINPMLGVIMFGMARHRLSGRTTVASATPEKRGAQYRSRHAELRFGDLAGGNAFCRFPLSYHPRRSLQRLA